MPAGRRGELIVGKLSRPATTHHAYYQVLVDNDHSSSATGSGWECAGQFAMDGALLTSH